MSAAAPTAREEMALRNASLCGSFDPGRLADAMGFTAAAPDYRDQVLRILSRHATETFLRAEGRVLYRWTIDPDIRRAALAELVTAPMLRQALEAAPPPENEDRLGQMLRSILRGTAPPEPRRARAEDAEAFLARRLAHWALVHDAAQFALAVPAIELDRARQLRDTASAHIRALQREHDVQIVLPRVQTGQTAEGAGRSRGIPLIGRGAELRRLAAHLAGERRDPRPMLLTGIGGSGKSALLASLLHAWQRRADRPVTILLDFDRRQLFTGEPVQMMHEVLRQLSAGLALGAPIPDGALKAVQDHLRLLRENLPSPVLSGHTPRSFMAQFEDLGSRIFPRLADPAAAPLRGLRIALVMDTFEAVHRQGGPVVEILLEIERRLREGGLARLRSVVSGRAPPLAGEEQLARWFGPPRRRIHLGGIGDADGARLLALHDRAGIFARAEDREAASARLNGHPLALIVLGRYASTHAGDAATLLAEISAGEGFSAEFAQAYLYDRILMRIGDPEVQALAHPGLVLRQLNADLLRLVLAEPCFGHPVTPDQAAELLARMAEEYWLVEEGAGDFPLRHRPDLRALMLPGLFAGPRPGDRPDERDRKAGLAARARQVAGAAAELFRNGPPAGDPAQGWWTAMPEADRAVEEAYYRAIGTASSPYFDRDFAERMFLALGEDLLTLPLPWIAAVRALRGEVLTEEERAALPANLAEAAEEAQFQAALRQGAEAIKAAAGARQKEELPGAFFDFPPEDLLTLHGEAERAAPESAEQIGREIARRFLLADLAGVAALAPDCLRALQAQGFDAETGDGFWFSPPWYCLLAAAAAPPDGLHDLPEPAPEDRPADRLAAALRAALAGDAGAAGAALARLLAYRDGWMPPEQMPLRANRLAGAAVLAALRDPGARPSATFRLSLRSFALAAALPGGARPGLPDLPMKLVEELHAGPVRLWTLQAIYRRAESAELDAGQFDSMGPQDRALFAQMLRGLTPELYEPLGILLREAPEPFLAETVAALRDGPAPHWPVDLSPEAGAGQVATVIEVADQCGVLDLLLTRLAGRDPRGAALSRAHAAIGAWFFPGAGPA